MRGSPGRSLSPRRRWKSTCTASSASSTSRTAPTITAGCRPCWPTSAPPEADQTNPCSGTARKPGSRPAELAQQQHVQGDDHCHAHTASDDGAALIDMTAHHVAAAGQNNERHQRERDAEGQYDLAEYQRAGGVGPGG